jgi:hypothetical protein
MGGPVENQGEDRHPHRGDHTLSFARSPIAGIEFFRCESMHRPNRIADEDREKSNG